MQHFVNISQKELSDEVYMTQELCVARPNFLPQFPTTSRPNLRCQENKETFLEARKKDSTWRIASLFPSEVYLCLKLYTATLYLVFKVFYVSVIYIKSPSLNYLLQTTIQSFSDFFFKNTVSKFKFPLSFLDSAHKKFKMSTSKRSIEYFLR